MDVLIGSPQRDLLLGGDGNDRLFGSAGVDQLYGGAGDDLLDGGSGLDFLYGGTGADNFVLRAGDGGDRVMDFNAAEGDLFLLDNLTFGALSFAGNQIFLGTERLATVSDQLGNPVTTLADNPQWFVAI
jgi:Ca2+-binding RTX toxin-like protein